VPAPIIKQGDQACYSFVFIVSVIFIRDLELIVVLPTGASHSEMHRRTRTQQQGATFCFQLTVDDLSVETDQGGEFFSELFKGREGLPT
jgi:hypothetical protein